jgi:hypothetical protein
VKLGAELGKQILHLDFIFEEGFLNESLNLDHAARLHGVLSCGISSMPSSSSTPSIHDVLVRSPSKSPDLVRTSHGDTKTRRKVPARNADVLVGIIASPR